MYMFRTSPTDSVAIQLQPVVASTSNLDQGALKQLDLVWSVLDENRDNTISKEELDLLLTLCCVSWQDVAVKDRSFFEGFGQQSVVEAARKLNTDPVISITNEQFLQAFVHPHNKAILHIKQVLISGKVEEMKLAFEAVDTDQNNTIDRSEVSLLGITCVTPLIDPIIYAYLCFAEQQVKEIFRLLGIKAGKAKLNSLYQEMVLPCPQSKSPFPSLLKVSVKSLNVYNQFHLILYVR